MAVTAGLGGPSPEKGTTSSTFFTDTLAILVREGCTDDAATPRGACVVFLRTCNFRDGRGHGNLSAPFIWSEQFDFIRPGHTRLSDEVFAAIALEAEAAGLPSYTSVNVNV